MSFNSFRAIFRVKIWNPTISSEFRANCVLADSELWFQRVPLLWTPSNCITISCISVFLCGDTNHTDLTKSSSCRRSESTEDVSGGSLWLHWISAYQTNCTGSFYPINSLSFRLSWNSWSLFLVWDRVLWRKTSLGCVTITFRLQILLNALVPLISAPSLFLSTVFLLWCSHPDGDLGDYSCLPPLIVLWNCDTEIQFSEVCRQKMWPCFYWCRPVFLPPGDKRKSSAKHTKDLYVKRMHQGYQIFEGKNSEIALFKQQASASPKYIAGLIKFSPFLSDLWPNLDNSSCGWLLVWLHCNIKT